VLRAEREVEVTLLRGPDRQLEAVAADQRALSGDDIIEGDRAAGDGAPGVQVLLENERLLAGGRRSGGVARDAAGRADRDGDRGEDLAESWMSHGDPPGRSGSMTLLAQRNPTSLP
jgi:hypothetical protein